MKLKINFIIEKLEMHADVIDASGVNYLSL